MAHESQLTIAHEKWLKAVDDYACDIAANRLTSEEIARNAVEINLLNDAWRAMCPGTEEFRQRLMKR